MPAILERESVSRVGSEAFNLEYKKEVPKKSLYEDIVSYIGEYRLNLQKFDYSLKQSSAGLADPNTGESMLSKAKSSIEDKGRRGLPTHREQSELWALGVLRNSLPFTQAGDTILWASPQGPKEEGYGEYGFLFVGKIGEDEVKMTAVHIDNPTLEQYSTAMTILTGVPTNYYNADRFLSEPRILQEDIDPAIIDKVLEYVFQYKVDEKEKERLNRTLGKLDPVIEDLIKFVKTGTNQEKLRAFHALENYALQLKDEEASVKTSSYSRFQPQYQVRLADIINSHGYEPPKAAGSCGSTDSSSSLLSSSLQKILKELDIETESECNCPDGNTDNHYHCPDCNKKYADETNTERTKKCPPPCGFEFGC
ncbi:MAG: hypothetical protein WD992_00145 [Candidatus Levyibacteriota bacterium]